MSSTSASAAAAGSGGHSGVVAVINHSATQDDEQSKSSDLLARMVKLHHQMSDSIRYLAAKGSVGKKHLPMLERAIADSSSALDRLDGLALLEGHFKNFALAPPDDEVEEGWGRIEPFFAEAPSITISGDLSDHSSDAVDSQTETLAQGPGSRFADKAVTHETTKATQTQKKAHLIGFEFVRQLYALPETLMHGTLFPLIHQHPHTALAKVSSALCCTSPAVGSAVAAALIAQIDSIIERLKGLIGYTQIRRHLQWHPGRCVDVRRPSRLIRLHYVMVTGGDWTGSAPLLRLAKSCSEIQSLPIELTAEDLWRAGSKAVIDSRPPSMRQYALFSHRLGEVRHLSRDANGRERLGGGVVTVHTQQTVPVRYRDRFDAADPPCRHVRDFGSFRELVIESMVVESSLLQVWDRWCYESDPHSAEFDRICALIDQQPPVCRTINYGIAIHTDGMKGRLVILHGDEKGDNFMAYMEMAKWSDVCSSIHLCTTEAPHQGGSGPAAFPRTVAIANKRMGDAVTLLPEVNNAINTAVGVTST
ncbi:unnamed protein product [Vitrella brassicaformis CCMP3155]|uniref:Uncharacterized protein n=1 Tax=Vitrella brassicaformis (strain CCMP3155) TaxID=1169540 RepID=A0A0G4G6E3_VITBC|nr:unnamed protein product [Vitrella brassicaformis CCMP3155]|eukprot:CEM23829.1 unnamed protein product [Vitrella brassicaformis CCMP3155]